MTPEKWNQKFYYLLENNLIPVPEDYFKEDIILQTSEELEAIFTQQQEENLFLINQKTEAEISLED